MFLSILIPRLSPGPSSIRDLSMDGFPHTWEAVETHGTLLRSACQTARGTWLLILDEEASMPPVEAWEAVDGCDVLGLPPDGPLAPPFAVRRSLLEAAGGLCELPGAAGWMDLTLRLREAGARGLPWPHSPALPRGVLDRLALLALFCRHPQRTALQWALDQPDAEPARLEEAHQALHGHPVPAQCRFTLPELTRDFLEQAQPPLLPPRALEAILQAFCDRGTWMEGQGSTARFDRCHTLNTLLSKSPWKQALLRRSPLLRFPPPEGGGPLTLEVEGTYSVTLDDDLLEVCGGAALALPLPVESALQTILHLDLVHPTGAEVTVQPGSLRITLPEHPEPGLSLGYRFRARVQEGGPAPGPVPAAAPRTALVPRLRGLLEDMLRAIFPGPPPEDPLVQAQRIYGWIVEHIPFLVSDRMGLFALEARGGNCQHRVRLFALLAAQVGLHVREQAGMLAGPISATGSEASGPWARCQQTERGHAPFHAWGEVWIPGTGWLPFDFIGTDNGPRRVNACNVPEPALREHLGAWGPRLEAYAFGRIDPYRVHLAAAPQPFQGVPTREGTEDLQRLWQRAWGTRHTLELTLRGLPPEVLVP